MNTITWNYRGPLCCEHIARQTPLYGEHTRTSNPGTTSRFALIVLSMSALKRRGGVVFKICGLQPLRVLKSKVYLLWVKMNSHHAHERSFWYLSGFPFKVCDTIPTPQEFTGMASTHACTTNHRMCLAICLLHYGIITKTDSALK